MATEKRNFIIKEGVSITDEVVAIMAGLAATEVDGVDSLAGNLTSEVIAKVGMMKLSKGVKIVMRENHSLQVKVAVNIIHGYNIPDVSAKIQEKIATGIENMTGLTVGEVNVRIASVVLD